MNPRASETWDTALCWFPSSGWHPVDEGMPLAISVAGSLTGSGFGGLRTPFRILRFSCQQRDAKQPQACLCGRFVPSSGGAPTTGRRRASSGPPVGQLARKTPISASFVQPRLKQHDDGPGSKPSGNSGGPRHDVVWARIQQISPPWTASPPGQWSPGARIAQPGHLGRGGCHVSPPITKSETPKTKPMAMGLKRRMSNI